MAKNNKNDVLSQGDETVNLQNQTPNVQEENPKLVESFTVQSESLKTGGNTKKRWVPKDAEFAVLVKFLSNESILAQADHVLQSKKDSLTFQLMIEGMKEL